MDVPVVVRRGAHERRCPLVSLDRVRRLIGGSLAGSRLLLLGVSYRQDVG